MMRLNSGLAPCFVEFLQSGVAERLDHIYTISLRFAVVQTDVRRRVAPIPVRFPNPATGAPGPLYLYISSILSKTAVVGELRLQLSRGRAAPVVPLVEWPYASFRERCPSHVRPNSRTTSIVPTRQGTVTRIICGVDIASKSLEARIGQQGAAGSFANDA